MSTMKDEQLRNYGVIFGVVQMATEAILEKRGITIDRTKLDTMIVNKLIQKSTRKKERA